MLLMKRIELCSEAANASLIAFEGDLKVCHGFISPFRVLKIHPSTGHPV